MCVHFQIYCGCLKDLHKNVFFEVVNRLLISKHWRLLLACCSPLIMSYCKAVSNSRTGYIVQCLLSILYDLVSVLGAFDLKQVDLILILSHQSRKYHLLIWPIKVHFKIKSEQLFSSIVSFSKIIRYVEIQYFI